MAVPVRRYLLIPPDDAPPEWFESIGTEKLPPNEADEVVVSRFKRSHEPGRLYRTNLGEFTLIASRFDGEFERHNEEL